MTKGQLRSLFVAYLESIDKATPAERKEPIGRHTQEQFVRYLGKIPEVFPQLTRDYLPKVHFQESFLSLRIAAQQVVSLIDSCPND